jgi:hypothetical protein
LKSFLSRNPELSVDRAEGLSLARAQRMNRRTVETFFNVLEKVVIENNLSDKPANIFSIDESDIQIKTNQTL